MGMFNAINIASTGLTAQRLRMDVISNNITNAETTRTPEGGPFHRQRVILRSRGESATTWKSLYFPKALDGGPGEGVEVKAIEDDTQKPPRLVYDPTHPDAIKSGPQTGYVEYPNVSVVEEMVDLISASRSYDANVAVVNGAKAMFMKALEIGKA